MEKIIVNPLSVRGLGDIVSPKILADFDVCDSVLASSTDTVNGVSMTVYTTSYRSGSRLLKSGDGFIVYTPDLTSMSVSVLLKTKSGSVISSASVSCIVDNETTLTATTNSSGKANFTIPFVEGESYYSLRFVYGGTSSVAGCSIYGRIFVGVPEELTLQGSDDLITVDETSRLTATLTGVDMSDEHVPIPLATVDIYECMGYYRLLDKIVVPCESTGTNYCDSIGLDLLDWDLSQSNWAIEFDFSNTTNGGRLCIGDKNSWTTGAGAGDNYLYCGTSTAGNGGYGTKRNGTTDNSSAGAVTTGATLHYKIVKYGNTISYYLNGTLKGTKTASWVDTIDEWSIYLQLWNDGETTIQNLSLDLSPKIRVSPGIVESGDTETLTVTLVDPVDGSRIPGETISVYVDDGNSGLSLVTNKSVLSYSNGESCTLTATLLDENNTPISGEDVVFKANGVTLDTKQTNSSGVATYTYNSAGSGDVLFTVEAYGVTDTLTVEDCLTAKVAETTITNSSGTKISSVGLDTVYNIQNTDFSLEFDGTGNGVLNIGAKNQWSSSSANYRATIGYADGKNYWSTRTSSTTEGYGSDASTSTQYHYKITREGTTVKFYVDDTLIQTRTFSSFSSYSSWSIYSIIWGSGTQKVKNIKLKPL